MEKKVGNENLVAALVKFQHAIKSIGKTATAEVASMKGSYTYRYTPLAVLWDQVREPLHDAGLAVIQGTTYTDPSVPVVVWTRLLHNSGEYQESFFPLVKIPERPQELGILLTYIRRYQFSMLLGLTTAEEDPDGHGAEDGATITHGNGKTTPPQRTPAAHQAPSMSKTAPAPPPAAHHEPPPEQDDEQSTLEAQLFAVPDGWHGTDAFGNNVVVGVIEATSKKATSKGGYRYSVKMGDEWFATFSDGAGAEFVGRRGKRARITYTVGDYGNDIVAILVQA